MSHVIATKGLPASGKTTWAKSWLASHEPGTWVRINKDCLRDMLYFGKYDPSWEQRIRLTRDALLVLYLELGLNVVIDDTNFGRHVSDLRVLVQAQPGNHVFEVRDFTSVSPEVCIERDARRLPRVGEDVIVEMYRKYIAPEQDVVANK